MKNTQPGDKEILENIDDSITQVDEQRLGELNKLALLQEVKNEALTLESKRLESKYGKDHPRVQKVISRLSYNQEMFAGLSKEVERAATKTTPLPNNAWRIHGKIYGRQNLPQPGVTVFLSDEKKMWIRQLGNACTDDAGYYSITVEENLLIDLIEKKQPLYLSVSDKNQQLLYQDPDPLFAAKSIIDYRDVYINGETCVPPPARNGNDKTDTKPLPR